MATRCPSLLSRALSSPPLTQESTPATTDYDGPSKSSLDPLTPPTSPVRSRSSSNLAQQWTAFPPGQPLLNNPKRPYSNGTIDPYAFTKPSERYIDEILTCPFDVEVLHNHRGQDQIFGYGAWSTVFKGTARVGPSPLTSFSFMTPPSSPTLLAPAVVAVKRPARSDAVPILDSEAKVLSYLSKVNGNTEYVVQFYGILANESSLVMAAIPLSLEDHIKRCSVSARRNLTTWNVSKPVIGSSELWLDLAHSMISALLWLHEDAGVVHGDVKPGNFLLQPKATYEENEFAFQPLFIDFSSSHRLGPSDPPQNTLSAVTREYTAPELLVSSVLRDPKSTGTKASDVFSMAVTLLVAATGDTMVYPGSIFQRQAMATEGWQVLNLVRSGDSGVRVPREGIVERALERAVLRANMRRISARPWLDLIEEIMLEEPQKKL